MLDVTPEIGHVVAPFGGRMLRILDVREGPAVSLPVLTTLKCPSNYKLSPIGFPV
jgi:hypothetical protein